MGKRQEQLETLKAEVAKLLEGAEVVEVAIKEQRPSFVYLVDAARLSRLIHLQGRHDFLINESEGDEKRRERNLKKYGFERACKIFNPYSPCYNYSFQIYRKWKQVNDPTKVKERLDEEYAVWAHAYKKHAFEELDASQEADPAFIAAQKEEIERAIAAAHKELLFIKEHFEQLEVRISSRDRAREYGTIHYNTEESPKQKKAHISISKFNILWYKEREDTSLETFLKKATHAFGDVYYLKLKSLNEEGKID